MIRDLMNKKYGKFVTDRLLSEDNRVLIDRTNEDGIPEQLEILRHISNLSDDQGNLLMPKRFLKNDVKWGMDFSSWLGPFGRTKELFFIGAEPHLNKNFQLVYDFGSHSSKTTEESSMEHFERQNDIWSYLTKIFVSDISPATVTSFLSKCYITDLSHIVPKNCGQIDDICAKLQIDQKDWKKFRTDLAATFLPKEIAAINPRYIILHGNAARLFFQNALGVRYEDSFSIEGSKNLRVLTGYFSHYRVISIPHLKGDMRNKLWQCKKDPKRPESVRQILTRLIELN